jgi:hypothetical protein
VAYVALCPRQYITAIPICSPTTRQYQRIFYGTKTADSVTLISDATFKRLHTPCAVAQSGLLIADGQPEVSTLVYSLGTMHTSYRGIPFIFHLGSVPGFESVLGFLPTLNKVVSALCPTNGGGNYVSAVFSICGSL